MRIASAYFPYNNDMIILTSTSFNTFPTAASFLARGNVSYFFSFFICTHLSHVKRKGIVKNNFHCTLGEPTYHGTPRRTYFQFSIIIESIHRGTDSKVVEKERNNTFCCLLAENIHSLVGVAGPIV